MRRAKKWFEDDTRTALIQLRRVLRRRVWVFWLSFLLAVLMIAFASLGSTDARLALLASGGFALVVLYQLVTKARARKLRTHADHLELQLDEVFAPASAGTRSDRVFVIHGHDRPTRDAVVRHLTGIHLIPVVIQAEAHQGLTILEKFEEYADSNVGYAVAILTGDDRGGLAEGPLQPRARQNVIFELGYFMHHLSRENVSVLQADSVELPSDIAGLGTILLDEDGHWKDALNRELRAAGFKFAP